MKEQTEQLDTKAADKQTPTQWTFHQTDANDQALDVDKTEQKDVEPLTWTASEFIHHQKSVGWYMLLGLATIILAGIIFLLTRDKISTGFVIFAALIFGYYANRKPRTLNYKLDDAGLTIEKKFYSYTNFKSFAITAEGAFSSIVLMPLKRFMPSISIYYEPKDEARITDILAMRLPMQMHKSDVVDSLMNRIRF